MFSDLSTKTDTKQNEPRPLHLKIWLLNWFKIGIPAVGYFGCQLSWAIQGGFITPELTELGLSPLLINYAWLAGPISGLITQPIIGVISDSMDIHKKNSFASKYGRRRPFIFAGCIIEVIALNIFSNTRYVSYILFNNNDYAIYIGIIAFWIIDISNNMIQAPLRALVCDMVPKQYHSAANGLFGLLKGIGSCTGYIMGYFLSYNSNSNGISLLFAASSIILTIMCVLTLYLSKGEKLINDITLNEYDDDYHTTMGKKKKIHYETMDFETKKMNNIQRLWNIIKFTPTPVTRAFVVQFFLYFGSFGQFIYVTDWFGRNVTNGDPQSDDPELVNNYHYGIKMANLASTLMAILSMFISMLIPQLCKKYGYKLVWMSCMIQYCCVLIAMSYCKSVKIGILLIALTCISRAAAPVIGWSIVTEALVNSKLKGTYSTLFNVAPCLAQMLFSLMIGHVIQYYDNDVSYAMLTGGIGCFIGIFFSQFIVEP